MLDAIKTGELEMIQVPEGVQIEVKPHLITVTGSRGTFKLIKNLNIQHVDMDIRVLKGCPIAVTGSRGTLTRNIRHVDMDIRVLKGKSTKVTSAVWQAAGSLLCTFEQFAA